MQRLTTRKLQGAKKLTPQIVNVICFVSCSAKSSVAAHAAQAINPAFQVQALQNRVSPDTEDVFDDAFWDGLDLVVNALDNVNARLYVDARCVYFGKPLLESGTLGPKCNTQMVIPLLTENYGEPAKRLPSALSDNLCVHGKQPCLCALAGCLLNQASARNASSFLYAIT